MTIYPQIFRTYDGIRLITYSIRFKGEFIGYSKCFCQAERAVKEFIEATGGQSLIVTSEDQSARKRA